MMHSLDFLLSFNGSLSSNVYIKSGSRESGLKIAMVIRGETHTHVDNPGNDIKMNQ